MSINELKRAIKAAEKARSAWDGIGTIPVSYDELCSLRAQLTDALIEVGVAEGKNRRKEAEDKSFWDGINSRVEARQADGLNEAIAEKLMERMLGL